MTDNADRIGKVGSWYRGELDDDSEPEYHVDFGKWIEEKTEGREPFRWRAWTLRISGWNLTRLPRSLPAVVEITSMWSHRDSADGYGPFSLDLLAHEAVTRFVRAADKHLIAGNYWAAKGDIEHDLLMALTRLSTTLRDEGEPKEPTESHDSGAVPQPVTPMLQ